MYYPALSRQRHWEYCLAINNLNQVVGWSSIDSGGAILHASSTTEYHHDERPELTAMVVNLDGWTLTKATAISSNGRYIVGYGTNPSGQIDAFELKAVLPGDANGDGKVDINDLTIVLARYGQTGMTWTQGDFNNDGKVDINDLTIVLAATARALQPLTAVSPPCPSRAQSRYCGVASCFFFLSSVFLSKEHVDATA